MNILFLVSDAARRQKRSKFNLSVEQVVDKLVAELEDQLYSKRVSLALTDRARSWLAKKGHNRKFGARPMERLIDREIRRKMADEILFGELEDGGTVTIDEKDDRLAFEIEQRKIKPPVGNKNPAQVG